MTSDQVMWRKSSYSVKESACVEVAPLPHGTGVRDSKNIDGGELETTRRAWRSFVTAIRTGRV